MMPWGWLWGGCRRCLQQTFPLQCNQTNVAESTNIYWLCSTELCWETSNQTRCYNQLFLSESSESVERSPRGSCFSTTSQQIQEQVRQGVVFPVLCGSPTQPVLAQMWISMRMHKQDCRPTDKQTNGMTDRQINRPQTDVQTDRGDVLGVKINPVKKKMKSLPKTLIGVKR